MPAKVVTYNSQNYTSTLGLGLHYGDLYRHQEWLALISVVHKYLMCKSFHCVV